MIKWPEPALKHAVDDPMYGIVNQDYYSESQLKQAVRDALQHAADEIKVEADYSGSNRKAVLMWSVDKLRALIEEIE